MQSKPLPAVLFVDDEPAILDGVERVLRGKPYRILRAESAEAALERLASEDVAVIVSDQAMSGMTGTELLREVRTRYPRIIRIVLSGSLDPRGITDAVNRAGVFRYLLKPSSPADLVLAVEQGLSAYYSLQASQTAVSEVPVDALIPELGIHVQPIYDATTGALFAHEALLRTPAHVSEPLDVVLRSAERENRIWQVDRRVRELVATAARERPPGTCLFINQHPSTLLDPALYDHTDALRPLAPAIVIELTERAELTAIDDLPGRLDSLRRFGYRIAIDDMGAGYSGLNAFTFAMPDFVKFDRELMRDIHATAAKQRLVRSIASACAALEVRTIAEGIENADALGAAISVGCHYVQGYFLGVPGSRFATSPVRLPG